MTQREFARMLHVSQATVSMALKDSPEISLKMRRHIQAFARRVGYRPNLAGQLLRKGKNNLIGVIMPSMQYSFYAELLEKLHEYAQKKGYILLLERSGEEKLFEHAVKTMTQYNVAGLIAETESSWIEKYVDPDMPIILINSVNRQFLKQRRVASVCPDLFDAGFRIGQYLIQHSRRNLVYLGHGTQGNLRYNGLYAACAEAGIPAPEILPADDNTAESGYVSAGEILRKYPGCDAVVAHNDNTAIGVLRRFYEEKIAIPERIAVTGFDNITSGAYSAPALTSIGTPFDVFAGAIIESLLKMISSGSAVEDLKLEVVINPRESA